MIALFLIAWAFAVLIVLGIIAHGAATWIRDHRKRTETRRRHMTSIINRARTAS